MRLRPRASTTWGCFRTEQEVIKYLPIYEKRGLKLDCDGRIIINND